MSARWKIFSRRVAALCAGLWAGLWVMGVAPALAEVKVVASFSVLADMARAIGGDKVTVASLIGPDADAHVFQPSPSHGKLVAGAALVVVNGLGFEGWLDRLIKASGYRGAVLVASDGVAAMVTSPGHAHGHSHGPARGAKQPPDPHAWQDLRNGQIYVRNIVVGLIKADPTNADYYRANGEKYLAELAALDRWAREELGAIPEAKRKIISSHDAFGYFTAAYGVTFLSPVGVSTEKEPTPKDVARLIAQMKRESVRTVFVENMTDPRLVAQIAKEAGGAVGGTLYADALSKPDGPAGSYVAMFRHNVSALRAAMARH
ncbi:MAG: metal ABC transporter substrate-binding protein [Alphaproteobacteria bacterium]